jgi:aspartyl-tRNA synthetase
MKLEEDRIHDKATQQLMFKYLGFTEEEAKRIWILDGRISVWSTTSRRFSFGLDRLGNFGGQETIRLYYSKNNSGRDVMIDAPSIIDDAQLKSYILKIVCNLGWYNKRNGELVENVENQYFLQKQKNVSVL